MATDYEVMRKRDETRAEEMKQLFAEIASLMPGWSVKRNEDSDEPYRAYVLERDGMGIHFSRDHSG